MERIGTIQRVMHYPVKGMMGCEVNRAHVNSSGLEHDREFYFVKPEVTGSPATISVNIRNFPGMLLFQPAILHEGKNTTVTVRTPHGKLLSLSSDELTRALENGMLKKPDRHIELRRDETGMHDSSPVSIFSQQTLRALKLKTGALFLDPLRFRANLYVSWSNDLPFYEDQLVGTKIRIGDNVVLNVTKKDTRCVVTQINPRNGRNDVNVLAYLRDTSGCAGVYAKVESDGVITKGDAILIE